MNWILYVERALRWICIILFTVLVTIVSLQVISRLLTGKSFTVVEELSMFLLAWSTFMCAAYAARKKAHVRVEYFTNKYLSEKRKKHPGNCAEHRGFADDGSHSMGVFWLCRTADEGEYGCAAVQQRTNVFVISGWDAFFDLIFDR